MLDNPKKEGRLVQLQPSCCFTSGVATHNGERADKYEAVYYPNGFAVLDCGAKHSIYDRFKVKFILNFW
jgi:hypothetical protein